jgi:hypothetical protein
VLSAVIADSGVWNLVEANVPKEEAWPESRCYEDYRLVEEGQS